MTLDQGGVFSWLDRNVGKDGRFTVVKYPVGGADWWSGQGYWWDVEFWNESAVETMPTCPSAARRLAGAVRPADGRRADAADPLRALLRQRRPLPARRFQHAFDRGAYIVEPERPWRADWVARGSGRTAGRGRTCR